MTNLYWLLLAVAVLFIGFVDTPWPARAWAPVFEGLRPERYPCNVESCG